MAENIRKKAAELAKQFYAGEIRFSHFLTEVSELGQDELVEELVDLITHQPKRRRGFFGVYEKKYKAYMENIFTLIQRLEKG